MKKYSEKNIGINSLLDELEIKIQKYSMPLYFHCNVNTANDIIGFVSKRPGHNFVIRNSIDLIIDQSIKDDCFILMYPLYKGGDKINYDTEILDLIKKINSLSKI